MKGGRQKRGKQAQKRGHLVEYIALFHLMLKGYRILGFRLKMPQGEVDILAQKAKRLAIVEVKSRRTLDAALNSVSETQQQRLWQSGLSLQEKRPRLRTLDLNLDLYVITAWQWPRHIKNAFEVKIK